jgi:hypothetical protein
MMADLQRTGREFINPIGGTDTWDAACGVGRRIVHGERMSVEEFGKAFVAGFLNPWRCRFPRSRAKGLRDALVECAPLVSKAPAHVVEIRPAHLNPLGQAFERLLLEEHVGGTTASKALSALAPTVVVMWDAAIASHYGFSQNAVGYSRFLWLMAQTARELCEHEIGRSDSDAAAAVEAQATPPERGKPVPLAKLLDEWNWVRISNRAAEQ